MKFSFLFSAISLFLLLLLSSFYFPMQFQPQANWSKDFFYLAKNSPTINFLFFAIDTIFILNYLMVFCFLFIYLKNINLIISLVGLISGFLLGLTDIVENAFFISNAMLIFNNREPYQPNLLFFIIVNIKWVMAFISFYFFCSIFPMKNILGKIIKVSGLIFPIIGVIGFVFYFLDFVKAIFLLYLLICLFLYFRKI